MYIYIYIYIYILYKLSNPKPGHTTGRSGWGGARRSGEGGLHRVDPARRQPSLLPSSGSKTLSWTSLRKHEQTESYVNRRRNEISG